MLVTGVARRALVIGVQEHISRDKNCNCFLFSVAIYKRRPFLEEAEWQSRENPCSILESSVKDSVYTYCLATVNYLLMKPSEFRWNIGYFCLSEGENLSIHIASDCSFVTRPLSSVCGMKKSKVLRHCRLCKLHTIVRREKAPDCIRLEKTKHQTANLYLHAMIK